MVGKLLFRKCGGNGAGVVMLAILLITRAVSPSWSQPSEKRKCRINFASFYFGVLLPISLRLGRRGSMNMGIVSNGKLGQLQYITVSIQKNTSGIEVAMQHKLLTLPPPLPLLTLLTALTLSKQCMPLYVYC